MKNNIVILIGSLAVAFAAMEVVLRIFLPTPIQWKYPQEHYIYDNEIGHWLQPNQDSYTHDKQVKTNSKGIRDHEYPDHRGPNVVRVIAIGDSQTFGKGLQLSDTWPKLLERRLNERGGNKKWEVINCGLSATDTWQHEIILERMIKEYHPDIAIIAVYANDVTKPWAPDPNSASLKTSELRDRFVYFMKRSIVLLVARQGIQSLRQMISPTYSYLYENSIVTGDKYTNVEAGWSQVDGSLGRMKENCNKNNIDMYLLILSRRDQVSGHQKMEAFNNRIKGLAAKHSIKFMDPLNELKKGYERFGNRLFIEWDGHNSSFSNDIISLELSRLLIGG